MANVNSKSIYHAVLVRIVAWGALAVWATGSPLFAQDMIGGKFTLRESARLGDAVLAAGQYKFSIEPVGITQSISSIQQGSGHLVLVVMRPEKSGRAASVFATATPSSHARETSELILEPEKAGMLVQSIYLEKEGLVVDFNWSPKDKGRVVAQQTVPLQTAAVSRTTAN